jgi:hypothetical protein
VKRKTSRKTIAGFAEFFADAAPVDPAHTFLVFGNGKRGRRAFAELLKAFDRISTNTRKEH